MRGVAVDTGDTGERDGNPRFLGDLPDHRIERILRVLDLAARKSPVTGWCVLRGGFPDLDATSGQLPVAVVDPTNQEDIASDVADRGERGGQHVVRAGRVRILVVLA